MEKNVHRITSKRNYVAAFIWMKALFSKVQGAIFMNEKSVKLLGLRIYRFLKKVVD